MFNQDHEQLSHAMRSGVLSREQMNSRPPELADAGLYVFLRATPPHLAYLGRSLSLVDRVMADRRIRQVFSHVLTFDFPGVPMSLATSRELERRALRLAWDRWSWASWTNQTDLWVKFWDRCIWPGSPPIMHVLDQVLTTVEEFIEGQATFDASRPTYLCMNRILGRPRDEVHAFGAAAATGFTVLAGSRLSLSLKSADLLRAAQSPETQLAWRLWEQGILDRKSATRTREDGIYFLHDQEFANPQEAASVLLGRRVEVNPWREPTEEERLRFSVPPGTHRRWR